MRSIIPRNRKKTDRYRGRGLFLLLFVYFKKLTRGMKTVMEKGKKYTMEVKESDAVSGSGLDIYSKGRIKRNGGEPIVKESHS